MTSTIAGGRVPTVRSMLVSLQNRTGLTALQTRIAVLAACITTISLLVLLFRPNDYQELPIGSRSHAGPRNLFQHVYNQTLGFQKVFVLNMPSRTDHRDAVTLAATLTGFKVNIIPGVDGSLVDPKALPDYNESFGAGLLGSWRAHMDVMRKIVEDDIGSALIFEDDVDWDIQLKDRMYDFALSAHAVQKAEKKVFPGARIPFEGIDRSASPVSSPYGDHWDALWIGHCGMRIQTERPHVLHKNDPSVPELQYLKSWEDNVESPLTPYGHHVRMVGRNDGTCSLAYAVTQKGARKILYDMGVNKLWSAFDVMFASFCQVGGLSCLGSLPQLFDHHRPKGPLAKDSAISGTGDGVREKAFTNNIRYSVRLNMKKLIDGDTNYEDQFPDASTT